MEALGKYILSVTAAAMIVGIVSGCVDSKSGAGAMLRLIGGLFLTFTIIQPIARLDFTALTAFAEDFSIDGEAASAQGEIIAGDTLRGIIKSEMEAYILDKAGLYQTELTVEVTLSLDDVPTPESVRLSGAVSPYAKTKLQQMIEEDLGIPKENQLWIG